MQPTVETASQGYPKVSVKISKSSCDLWTIEASPPSDGNPINE
jgi:hypothetical protein